MRTYRLFARVDFYFFLFGEAEKKPPFLRLWRIGFCVLRCLYVVGADCWTTRRTAKQFFLRRRGRPFSGRADFCRQPFLTTARLFGAGRPADCGTLRGQTRQASGADRLTTRARLADNYENIFFLAANFDKRTDTNLPTATQADFCSYSFTVQSAGNDTPDSKKERRKFGNLRQSLYFIQFLFRICIHYTFSLNILPHIPFYFRLLETYSLTPLL